LADNVSGQRLTAGTGGILCISGAFHWDAPETHRKMEAVFRPELSRIFFDDFRPFPTEKHRELVGIHRKKSKKLPAGILLPFPVLSHGIRRLFRIFPAGYRRIR